MFRIRSTTWWVSVVRRHTVCTCSTVNTVLVKPTLTCLCRSSDTWEQTRGSRWGGFWETTPQTHPTQRSVLQLRKIRWNWLMENSSRSCFSRNNTLQAFVCDPLWSVCVSLCECRKTGSCDLHTVCPLRVFIPHQIGIRNSKVFLKF